MFGIPKPALTLGLAGVLPFIASAIALWVKIPVSFNGFFWWLLPVVYGLGILSFMSGCIWAFAARNADVTGYALSTLPCLLGIGLFVFIGPFTPEAADGVLLGYALLFPALLTLDFRASQLGQTPEWWMRLRLLLTCLVVLSLIMTVLA